MFFGKFVGALLADRWVWVDVGAVVPLNLPCREIDHAANMAIFSPPRRSVRDPRSCPCGPP
eukprot:9484124-Pyramimonas_sp.AAC.1